MNAASWGHGDQHDDFQTCISFIEVGETVMMVQVQSGAFTEMDRQEYSGEEGVQL